ncbi:hypothetical protein DY000_02054659 [Brassica cretica]|uniref:PGG domain-containing protein n=1 Tax=Brassica cretica TaxID=69181 RepID=A0ABQ7AC41_BRACR|nr:hypothetical protein DY000_02054659 [Brassica cretica]
MQPIFHAILQNDLPTFLSLVEERNSSLEERTDKEQLNDTVLHMAAKLGHGELVSMIIDRRPSLVCSLNAEGNTPLHLAALLGYIDILVQMLETGLEACTARNNNNDTPLHLACRSISMEAAKLIAEKTNSVDHGELNFAISTGSTYNGSEQPRYKETRISMEQRFERRKERDTPYKPREWHRGEDRRGQGRENKDRSYDLEAQRYRRERQMSKTREVSRRDAPVRTRTTPTQSKGVPFESSQPSIPKEALETAMEEIREVMTQYSNIADPSESAARKERFRQAEEQGQIKETAEAMVRAELDAQTQDVQGQEVPEKRVPATHRISLPTVTETHLERIPTSRRLSIAPPPVSEKGRLPIAARLGTTKLFKPTETGGDSEATTNRKPGRPLGKRKVLASPMTGAGANPRRRKTQQANAPKLSFHLAHFCDGILSGVVKIILERFPDLAREEAWPVQGGSLSTLLHHACDRGDLELTRILFRLDQRLEEALNTNGLSPLHLAVLRGSVEILEEFINKAPLSFLSHTPSKETVFHLAARNKNMDAFVFMAERLGSNSQFLLPKTDENGNTVLHTAASVACGAPLIRYIIAMKIVDISNKNKMGFAAYHLLPHDAQDFELLSSWLRFDTETSDELDSDVVEIYLDASSPVKPLRSRFESSDTRKNSHEDEVIKLLNLIGLNTSEMVERKTRKAHGVKKGSENLEYDMYIEALQNARNTITIVAVLIASVAYAGGINPPGGVYQDGPWRGKSIVGKTTAFKVFAICNNIALFTSLAIVILLVSIIPHKRKPLKKLLVATHRMMWVSIGFMATAYVAASWVTLPHYHGTRWLFPAIVAVAGGALAVCCFHMLVLKPLVIGLRRRLG